MGCLNSTPASKCIKMRAVSDSPHTLCLVGWQRTMWMVIVGGRHRDEPGNRTKRLVYLPTANHAMMVMVVAVVVKLALVHQFTSTRLHRALGKRGLPKLPCSSNVPNQLLTVCAGLVARSHTQWPIPQGRFKAGDLH